MSGFIFGNSTRIEKRLLRFMIWYCRFAFILVNKDHLLTMGTSLFQCRLYAFQLCYFMTKAQSVAVYWQNHWLRACWQRRVPGHTVYIAEDIVKLLAKLDHEEGRMDDFDLKRVSSAGLFGEFLKYQFNQWNSGTVCIQRNPMKQRILAHKTKDRRLCRGGGLLW